MIQFICGCDSKLDPPITRETFKTFDSVVEDAFGHLVCILHHERLKGWRSVPYQAGRVPAGADPAWTPLEFERWKIFGERPRVKKLEIVSGVEDKRDNREPEYVGLKLLAERNGHK